VEFAETQRRLKEEAAERRKQAGDKPSGGRAAGKSRP
jgi:hypothetical protein